MEERLKLGIFVAIMNGLMFFVGGISADWSFPALGWAHNPGFAWGQVIMALWGALNLIVAIYLIHDWFRKGY